LKKIVECVPNFSEGRRKEVINALASALSSAPGAALLDTEMDAEHNRCVISVAGEPEAVARGVVAAVGKAAELIDLRQHRGEHPRMGAADVIPFIPIAGMSIEECVELSVGVAREIARRYHIPVYLYERSARIPARQDLAYVRKGQFEGIREEIRTHPERKPDFGPCEVHPSAGATAVGARFPLIAYNIYLRTSELKIAQDIARSIRYSSGGLRYVKALGFEIKSRNQVQVSMNLTNYEATPISRVFELVCREAERHGTSVASSEIVGLAPQKALDVTAEYYLRLENFSRNQILENRLSEAFSGEQGIDGFLARVASSEPLPGGGSVAALAGSLAAALGEMMAGLTEGRAQFIAEEARLKAVHAKLTDARNLLRALVKEDSIAFQSLLDALRLPRSSDAEKAARAIAIEGATRIATEVPLRTARASFEVLESVRVLLEIGNPNARSDAAVGAQLAGAGLIGAYYNIAVNVRGMKDRIYAESCRAEGRSFVEKGREILRQVDELIGAS
jgi:glutamate formiminotransferase/formiminotetrahydrofolate cyclodeaminase